MSYDPIFMKYASNLNESSARVVVKLLADQFKPTSVVDFGCAQGGWLREWQRNGVMDIQGLDGAYVDQSMLLIEPSKFMAADLSQPINLKKTFDIAQCVEVAEHLPEASARLLVTSLTAHSNLVIFSAAPPGQGGRGHLNEQRYEYWRDLFSERSFQFYDWIRPQISNRNDVQPWYRYNLFLVAHRDVQLPNAILSTQLAPPHEIADISPPLYQMRKKIVRLIPGTIQDKISQILARWKS